MTKLTQLEEKMLQLEADKAKQDSEKAKQDAVKAEEEKKRAEQKAKKDSEDAERRKKLAEETAKGYDSGITYDQLARTPEKYDGSQVKFSGEVIQVVEDSNFTEIRLAVNSNYDTILHCSIPKFTGITARVLEHDMITISGLSDKLYTYTSVMGNKITVPSVYVSKVE